MPAGIFGVVNVSISLARSSSERQADPLHGAEQIEGDGDVEAGRPFEEQPGAAARGLGDAIGDGADLQIRADGIGDPRQLALLVERGDELREVVEHG
jgi:hypothetical protein